MKLLFFGRCVHSAARRLQGGEQYPAHEPQGFLGRVAIVELLYKALHELEALQTRRSSGPTLLARLDLDGQAAVQVERDLQRMTRERLLPDEKILEKVVRYEAHLSRDIYKAMHELEALQARRTGGAAPLARLGVDGLVGS